MGDHEAPKGRGRDLKHLCVYTFCQVRTNTAGIMVTLFERIPLTLIRHLRLVELAHISKLANFVVMLNGERVVRN